MASFSSSPKSILVLLVLALVNVSNINAASTYSDIDISKTEGNGDAIKAAANKVCGADLPVDELTRRQGLARAAISDSLNPQLINALKADNAELEKSLVCQKLRIQVVQFTCVLQASIKKTLKCETDKYTKKLDIATNFTTRACSKADPKLFVSVTGINEPKAPGKPPKPCAPKAKKPLSTSKYTEFDITKTPGNGDASKTAAEKVCGANLSIDELKHRAFLGSLIHKSFFSKKIKAAAGNVALANALTCQDVRNKIMVDTCFLQSATKENSTFYIQVSTVKQQKNIVFANKVCPTADPKLFVTVPEIKEGKSSPLRSNSKDGSSKHSAAYNTPIPSAVFLAFIIYLFN